MLSTFTENKKLQGTCYCLPVFVITGSQFWLESSGCMWHFHRWLLMQPTGKDSSPQPIVVTRVALFPFVALAIHDEQE